MLSIKIILNFVYFVFSLLLARETGRESACNPNCTKSVQKELAVDYYFLWTGVFNTPSFSQKTPTLLIFLERVVSRFRLSFSLTWFCAAVVATNCIILFFFILFFDRWRPALRCSTTTFQPVVVLTWYQ